MKKILPILISLLIFTVACSGNTENFDKSATLIVDCSTVLSNMDSLKDGKAEIIPSDGIIYKNESAGFKEGETAFDLFMRQMQQNKIQYEHKELAGFDTLYIEAINNLYSLDCGEESGWLFRINGEFPTEGCNKIILEEGDVVEFLYTCNWGADVGAF